MGIYRREVTATAPTFSRSRPRASLTIKERKDLGSALEEFGFVSEDLKQTLADITFKWTRQLNGFSDGWKYTGEGKKAHDRLLTATTYLEKLEEIDELSISDLVSDET